MASCRSVSELGLLFWAARQAPMPPARSATSLKPCSFSRLAAIDERYPPAQCTTIRRPGGSSAILSRREFSGMFALPSIRLCSHSLAVRTSRRNGGDAWADSRAQSWGLIRSVRSTRCGAAPLPLAR